MYTYPYTLNNVLIIFFIIFSFQELRRDLQAVIGTRANINIAQIENYGGETFLSEQLVQKMLNDSKTSFTRCKTVSITSITEILSTNNNLICNKHLIYNKHFLYLCN